MFTVEDLQVLKTKLEPDEIVICRISTELLTKAGSCEKIESMLKEIWPDNFVLVIDRNIDIDILKLVKDSNNNYQVHVKQE